MKSRYFPPSAFGRCRGCRYRYIEKDKYMHKGLLVAIFHNLQPIRIV